MECLRCGKEFIPPESEAYSGNKTNICGSCADELRAEDDANTAQAEAEEAERNARDRY